MKLFTRKLRKDNRGLSIVELICAVGILAAISAAVAGAMIVSSKSYQTGTMEASMQKEAQFTANVIEGLIVDATDTVAFDDGTKTLVITNKDLTHTIYLGSDNKLYYKCIDTVTGTEVDGGSVLATDVEDFDVDDSAFLTSRNAQVTIVMKNSMGRELSTVYNVTSRNNPTATAAAAISQSVSIVVPSEVILEPNETNFVIPVSVTATGGASSDFDCVAVSTDDPNTKAVKDGTNIKVTVGTNEKGGDTGKFHIVVSSVFDSSVSKTITVNVRRVLAVEKPVAVLAPGCTAMKENAVYEITTIPTGTNLDRVISATNDTIALYKNPYGVTWSFEVSTGEPWQDYIDIQTKAEDVAPYLKIRLKKNVEVGDSIKITATAKHPAGTVGGVATNKSGVYYDTVFNSITLKTGNFYLASEFLRGDDFVNLIELIDWDAIKNEYGGNRVWRDIRYAPAQLNADGDVVAITGAWSDWMSLGDGSTPGFVPIRPNELNLNPCVDYALEVRIRYGYDDGTITWPVEGTNEDEYMFRFAVPSASIRFNYYYNNGALVNFPVGTWGFTEDEALTLSKDTLYTFNITGDAGHVSKFFNNYMTYKLERWDTSGDAPKWVNASTEWGFMYPDGMKLKAPGTGQYRLTLEWKEDWYTSNWGTYIPYADETTGKGIIYFNVVG